MAKQKTKRRSSTKRRTHSSIDELPASLQKILVQMIVHGLWPDDYGKHPKGTPRYVNMVKYCEAKGHPVSHSAIGRYAKQLRSLPEGVVIDPGYKPPEPIALRMRDYLTAHIGNECQQASNIASDLRSCIQNPEDHPEAEHAIPRIRSKVRGLFQYIGQAIMDLQNMDYEGRE